MLRAQLAHAEGSKAEAVSDIGAGGGTAKTVKGADPAADRYMLAKSYRLLGDMRRSAGDGVGATTRLAGCYLPRCRRYRVSALRNA